MKPGAIPGVYPHVNQVWQLSVTGTSVLSRYWLPFGRQSIPGTVGVGQRTSLFYDLISIIKDIKKTNTYCLKGVCIL